MNFKIKSPAGLSKILKELKSKGKRVVFTNGCFDIIHSGHIAILSKAKRLGDILVVGLNSDSSVKSIKGSSRPVNNERDRARVLASLYLVDYVTVFNEPTPEALVRRLKPDVLVKGGDWKRDDIVGSDIVKSYGGRVVRVPFVKGYSTTSILKKLARS
ncbi:MAG: D-glycero-beta-D-manno-heptose 1-phosphate adenylyltransferase [Candidatus Omnitrophica bacterium]|nr:D-glycero-beta-D-manno-heptose 1-phosphate adenylyltransferase [Candidatus Omnitrophota bacterium]MBI5144369.1 D-glycero-beta-D-manno-heptose 1-phosphate adenylyltransferase [Candidatus Omnitrophota bacterium]